MPNLIEFSFAAFTLTLVMTGCTGTRPVGLGLKDGRLAPCPATLNCVSSQSSDPDHAVQSLAYEGTAKAAMNGLRQVILGMPRVRIVTEQDGYLHAEFTSALFRFVDDLEFSLNEPLHRIEVRSASRLGTSDLGVNRRRVEEIRARWTGRSR